ncbi:metallophosphoesterase [Ursidibacter sp. B-7004-1]
MEFRYYIIMAVSFAAMQVLLFNLSLTIKWLFKLSTKSTTYLRWIICLSTNSLMLLHITQIFPAFRIVAWLLVLLLFLLFISLSYYCIYKLSQWTIPRFNIHKWLRVSYPIVYLGFIAFTLYNAYVPKVVHYAVTLNKPIEPMRIGVASDLHLGKLFGAKQLDKLADIFNEQKVDLILLPGDIMDDNTQAYLAENMQSHFAKLKAPLGVYATMGNHDLFGAELQIAQEIRNAGIHLLWDQAVVLDGKFAIIGRNDELVGYRPSTEQLLQGIDPNLPIFLLDHRPTEIEKHSKLPIDVQVSGHTHNGQIFPANLITKLMYRLSYGYEQIGNGHYFVTSGYGFWGVPMRLGSQSEVFIIDIKGKH